MANARGKDGSASLWRYRDHSLHGTRVPRGLLRFSDHEWATIVAVAAGAGWSPAAWAQQIAFACAARRQQGLPVGADSGDEILDVLQEVRRLLADLGGNVNDVARTANATGELPSADALAEMLALLRERVQLLDTCVAVLRPGLMP